MQEQWGSDRLAADVSKARRRPRTVILEIGLRQHRHRAHTALKHKTKVALEQTASDVPAERLDDEGIVDVSAR